MVFKVDRAGTPRFYSQEAAPGSVTLNSSRWRNQTMVSPMTACVYNVAAANGLSTPGFYSATVVSVATGRNMLGAQFNVPQTKHATGVSVELDGSFSCSVNARATLSAWLFRIAAPSVQWEACAALDVPLLLAEQQGTDNDLVVRRHLHFKEQVNLHNSTGPGGNYMVAFSVEHDPGANYDIGGTQCRWGWRQYLVDPSIYLDNR